MRIVILLFAVLILNPDSFAEKRTLIITVGEYTEETGWTPISSVA